MKRPIDKQLPIFAVILVLSVLGLHAAARLGESLAVSSGPGQTPAKMKLQQQMLTSKRTVSSTNEWPATESANANGVGWFVIRDQSEGWGGGVGTGSFLTFESKNNAGQWGEWALVNGGLVDRSAGNEQGDIDLVTVVDGKISGAAIQGRWQGQKPSLLPINDSELDLGRSGTRWKDLHLSGNLYVNSANCPAGLSPAPKACMRMMMDGVEVFVPVY